MISDDEILNFIRAKQNEIFELSKSNLTINDKKLNHRSEYYKVKKHIDQFLIKDYYNRFITMPGLRGVGKTTILFQLYEYLILNGIDNSNILYLDVHELTNFFDLSIYDVINIYLQNIHETNLANLDKKIFIFIDEAHFDEKWADTGKLIYDKSKNVFMIFTGSSALDLEINADVIRRIKKEQIYPCNFQEYLHLKYNIKYDVEFSNYLQNLILRGDKESFDMVCNKEKNINKTLIESEALSNDINIELKKFLKSYGFAYAFNMGEVEIHKNTVDIINRVVEKDIPSLKVFNTSTNVLISRVITYLAMQKPGGTSNRKLAQYLDCSQKTINEILNVLEKTQLIFSLKPYGTGDKFIRKPWEYFFISPSIKASINYELGRYDLNSDKCFATLAETLLVSSLFKMKNERFNHIGLFYDSENKGVDVLIKDIDRIIPIEMGIGKKTKSQLKIAINNYGSDYGILVSNRTSQVKYIDDIIYIPLNIFSYL